MEGKLLVFGIAIALALLLVSQQYFVPIRSTAQGGTGIPTLNASELAGTATAVEAYLLTRESEPYPPPTNWVFLSTETPDPTRAALPATAVAATEAARMYAHRLQVCGNPCSATPVPYVIHELCDMPSDGGGTPPSIGVILEVPDAPALDHRYWVIGLNRSFDRRAFTWKPSFAQLGDATALLNHCQP